MKKDFVSFLVIYNGVQENLDIFLNSFFFNIKNIDFELIVLNNAYNLSENFLNDKIIIISEKVRLKPQDLVKKGIQMSKGKFIIFHRDNDVILDGYKEILRDYLKLVDNKNILKLPHKIKTESILFSKREILSGYCFSKELLIDGFPFDFMFRQGSVKEFNLNIINPNGKNVFLCNDLPMDKKGVDAKSSLIITVKNRLEHWKKSMPYLISQVGADYELLFVDYYSEDNFFELLNHYIDKNKSSFSPDLSRIRIIKLKENKKFSSCKAKNLGVRYVRDQSIYLAFSDIDTFLREDYLCYNLKKVVDNTKLFLVTRASVDRRLSTEVNYGNMIVSKELYYKVCGHNESIQGYGGDEDEFIYRLKNARGIEINPLTTDEARQYSILHGDEERLAFLEKAERSGLQNWDFLKSKKINWQGSENWGKQDVEVIDYNF